MKAHVVLVVLCVLTASMLAIAVAASDQQLRTGGESIVGVDHDDDRSTPSGTDGSAETSTPTPTSASVGGGGGSGSGSGGGSGGGSASTPTEAPTPDGTDGDTESTPEQTGGEPDEPTPTATDTPGTGGASPTADEPATEADDGAEEQAGFPISGLHPAVWIGAGIVAVLALGIAAARRR